MPQANPFDRPLFETLKKRNEQIIGSPTEIAAPGASSRLSNMQQQAAVQSSGMQKQSPDNAPKGPAAITAPADSSDNGSTGTLADEASPDTKKLIDAYTTFQDTYGDYLKPKERQYFTDKQDQLQAIRDKAEQEYKEGKSNLAWGEVAERVGQAIAQLGAGYYGLRKGVDLSGVQFSKANWDKKMDNLLGELNSTLKTNDQEANRNQSDYQTLARLRGEDARRQVAADAQLAGQVSALQGREAANKTAEKVAGIHEAGANQRAAAHDAAMLEAAGKRAGSAAQSHETERAIGELEKKKQSLNQALNQVNSYSERFDNMTSSEKEREIRALRDHLGSVVSAEDLETKLKPKEVSTWFGLSHEAGKPYDIDAGQIKQYLSGSMKQIDKDLNTLYKRQQAGGASGAPAAPNSDKVMVSGKNPETGQIETGYIPRTQLDDALKDGYKLVK